MSLESVLEAGKDSLRLTIDLVSGSEIDFGALDEAVTITGSEIGAVNDEESLVTGMLDLAAPQRAAAGGIDPRSLEAHLASIEAANPPPSFDDDGESSAFENTSILLHQFELISGDEIDGWSRSLERCTRGLDPVGVANLILDATRDTAERIKHYRFDAWMGTLIPTLRRTVAGLSDHLAEFSIDASAHGREALWPFVMDEFLSTLKGRRNGLDPRIHELDPVALEAAIGRLCQMPAIARQRVAAGMFSIEQTFAHPILLRLMQSPARHTIGPVLLGAFRETLPTDPGISFCVFAMRNYEESLGWLLSEQLQNPQVPVPPDVQRSAAWLLVSVLDSMPVERHSEVWIPAALEWLGSRDGAGDPQAQSDGTVAILTRIVHERDGFKKMWNKECRRAAKTALARGDFV